MGSLDLCLESAQQCLQSLALRRAGPFPSLLPASAITHVPHQVGAGLWDWLRGFVWEPPGAEELFIQTSVTTSQDEEAGGGDLWARAPARLGSPPCALLGPSPPSRSVLTNARIPNGALFLHCSSLPCCQHGRACPYRLLRQAE